MAEINSASAYEDIEIVQGSGKLYRFALRFPAMKMYEFNYAIVNAAKREIYNAMLENGEIAADDAVGYQMISSKLARTWLFRDGFESPAMLMLLCKWIIMPLSEDAMPALDALLEADEQSSGSWKDEEITAQIPRTLGQLLHAIVERDFQRKAGLNLLKLFFIRLISGTDMTAAKPKPTTTSSAKAGRGRKPSSPAKASTSA